MPTSEVTDGGGENRGPGQTAELLVGMNGVRPPNTDSNQEAAIIAFFNSRAHAAAEPNAHSSGLITHADVVDQATVQPWKGLVTYTVKTTPTHTPSALRAAFSRNLKKIESCIS